MKYLRDFLIGVSSFLIFMILRYTIQNISEKLDIRPTYLKRPKKIGFDTVRHKYFGKTIKFTYVHWLIIMSLWFGLWNVASRVIAQKYGLSKRMRFFVISIISVLCLLIIARILKIYELTLEEWIQYSLSRFLVHIFMWNIVFYYLDKYI